VSETGPVSKAKAPAIKKRLPVTKYTVPDKTKIQVVRKDNPKTPMSPSSKRFELYRTIKTVGEYRELMRKQKTPHYANLDLARDYARGHIKLVGIEL